jgi:hypothetical protein
MKGVKVDLAQIDKVREICRSGNIGYRCVSEKDNEAACKGRKFPNGKETVVGGFTEGKNEINICPGGFTHYKLECVIAHELTHIATNSLDEGLPNSVHQCFPDCPQGKLYAPV